MTTQVAARNSSRRRGRKKHWRISVPKVVTMAGRLLRRISSSLYLNCAPLVINLFAASLWWTGIPQLFEGPDQFSLYWAESRDLNVELTLTYELYKQKLQFFGYFLVVMLLLGRMRELLAFVRWEKSLPLLLVVLLLSSLVSDYPDRVFIDSFHLSFGFLAIWLFCRHPTVRRSPAQATFYVLLVPILLIQFGTFLLWMINPLSSISDLLAGKRMGGLGGNPNTLGALCTIAVWALLGLMCRLTPKVVAWWLALVSLGIVLFNLFGTGSATAQVMSAIIGVAYAAQVSFGFLGTRSRAVVIFLGAVVVLSTVFYLLALQEVSNFAAASVTAVGKDLTLTGRLDIWEVGAGAFLERPFFGWGYDGHQTVFEDPRFSVGYNQYHSGFIDTLINVGLTGFVAYLFVLKTFFTRCFSLLRGRRDVFPMLVFGFIGIVHNLTEYSIFRPNVSFWFAWTIVFMTVAVASMPASSARKSGSLQPAGIHRSNSRRATRGRTRLRW